MNSECKFYDQKCRIGRMAFICTGIRGKTEVKEIEMHDTG